MEELENRHGAETPADAAQDPEAAEHHHAAGEGGEIELEDEAGDLIQASSPQGELEFETESEFESEAESELEDEGDVLVAEAQFAPDEDPHVRVHVRIKAVIEAAIYITEEPLTAEQISTAIEQPIEVVKEILARLTAEYADPSRGLAIRELAGGYKMSTKAEHHEDIRQFVRNLQPAFKLSLAALETLAVIAYKQPITGPEILEIRGVQGAGVLKTLLDRRLIATAGRKNVVGKPILYKTTKEFLVQFGLSSLAELPTLKEFEELGRLALSDSETLDETGQNAGTTGFSDDGGYDGMIRPDLQEASGEAAPEEVASGEAAPEQEAPGDASSEGGTEHHESASHEIRETQHAVEAEAQPHQATDGSGETEDAAREVTQTRG